tara:strand:+ start:4879 stop:6054 length:1176 start_codon:yes stop_codon:yes gene_type:complete
MRTKLDIEEIELFLDRQGLSFKPLKAELLDHLISDVESRMRYGETFEIAWNQVKGEIPSNHFKILQQQTMETIDTRFRISRIFSNLFLALMIMGSFFKFMHLPGAGILLISSFIALAISLLSGSLSGLIINRGKQGGIWLVTLVLGVLLLLTAYCFRILHLPGAELAAIVSVGLLLVSVLGITIIIRRHSGEENLLTFLHEKYASSIQRALVVLLSVGVLFKIVAAAKGSDFFVGDVTLILLIYGAGIQLLLFLWRAMAGNIQQSQNMVLTAICAICLFLPILNFYIPFAPRMVMAFTFYILSGYLIYQRVDNVTIRPWFLLFAGLNIVHFMGWSLMKMEVLPGDVQNILYSIPVAIIFVVPFWLFRKNKLMLTYWVLVFGAFALQFTQNI